MKIGSTRQYWLIAVAIAVAVPAIAQTVARQAAPAPTGKPMPRRPAAGGNIVVPAIPPVQRTTLVRQLTGSTSADASSASKRFAFPGGPPKPNTLLIMNGNVEAGNSSALLSDASTVYLGIRNPDGSAAQGLQLFVCSISGPSISWSGDPIGPSKIAIGSTVPANNGMVAFAIDLSMIKKGDIALTSSAPYWWFNYCDVTPVKG